MKRLLSLLFLITVFSHVDLIAQSQKKDVTRSVKFIDLRESANALFWSSYREIPRLIMTAIENGSVKSYKIDYQKKSKVDLLTHDEYKERMELYYEMKIKPPSAYPNAPSMYVDFLFPSDIPYLGLDQTTTVFEEKEYTHVHYVNFYSNENFSEDRKTRQYRFSVAWEDFIAVLKQRPDVLYTPNIYGAWWRGNVFITNGRYLIETKTADFIELSRSYNIFPKDFQNLNYVATVDSLNKKNYESTMMDLYFLEEKNESYWKIKQIAFGTVLQDMSYLNERRFIYKWKDFVSILEKQKIASSSDIYTLADAFVLKKFCYTDSIDLIQISKNGKFNNGKKDILCSVSLKESFNNSISVVSNATFHTHLLESLYLEDTSNNHLNMPGHRLSEILYDYVLNGMLPAYEYDSLGTPMTINSFKYNTSQYLDVSEIFGGSIYEKGDTVSMNFYIEDWNSETRYFIVQEKFIGSDFSNDTSYISKLKRFYPPLISVDELNVIELLQHLSFDSEGNSKKYNLKVVALHVSADDPSNFKGIQYPVCYVRWNDLKALLLKDARAWLVYKGRQVNLIDMIENREFLSILLKTGYVEIGE